MMRMATLTMYFDKSAGSSGTHDMPKKTESSNPLKPPVDRGRPAAESFTDAAPTSLAVTFTLLLHASSSVVAVHTANLFRFPAVLLEAPLSTLGGEVHAACPSLPRGSNILCNLFYKKKNLESRVIPER